MFEDLSLDADIIGIPAVDCDEGRKMLRAGERREVCGAIVRLAEDDAVGRFMLAGAGRNISVDANYGFLERLTIAARPIASTVMPGRPAYASLPPIVLCSPKARVYGRLE
jgi:hypothetical protein